MENLVRNNSRYQIPKRTLICNINSNKIPKHISPLFNLRAAKTRFRVRKILFEFHFCSHKQQKNSASFHSPTLQSHSQTNSNSLEPFAMQSIDDFFIVRLLNEEGYQSDPTQQHSSIKMIIVSLVCFDISNLHVV